MIVMDKIFISYRREDSEGFARSLFQSLVKRFGEDHIFMDVEDIALGMDFVEAIDSSLADCGAMLVLIGRDWLNCTDEQGLRRLEKDDDFVRTELARAIERKVRVIPILLKGAQMPKADELPEELRSLARRQAIELRHEGWDHDVDHLSSSLEKAIGLERTDIPKPAPAPPASSTHPPPSAKPRWSKTFRYIGIMTAIIILLGIFINNMDKQEEGHIPDTLPATEPVSTLPPEPTRKPERVVPPPAPTRKPPRVISITGLWFEQDGARVEIVQTGATAVSKAIDPATGILISASWRLNGRNFEFEWIAASGNQGYGWGVISQDYNSIQYEAIDYVSGIKDSGRLVRSSR